MGDNTTGVRIIGLHIVKGPRPLLADNINDMLRVRILVEHLVLGTNGIEEQHADHKERNDGVEHFKRKVIPRLARNRRVTVLTTELESGKSDEPPYEYADDKRRNPGANPHIAHVHGAIGRRIDKTETSCAPGASTAAAAEGHHRYRCGTDAADFSGSTPATSGHVPVKVVSPADSASHGSPSPLQARPRPDDGNR